LKVLKWIGIVVGTLLLLVVVIGLFLPADWRVERSVVIRAAPETIHPWIDDMAKWKQWSPFDSEDPAMTMQVSNPSAGVGAWREWKSEKMGDGRIDVVRSDPAKGVWMKLTMAGWDSFGIDFVFEPAGDGATKVTWIDAGKAGANPFHRWMVQGLDSMMGPTFERGLASLKGLVEGGAGK
jgi:hypothetical protein